MSVSTLGAFVDGNIFVAALTIPTALLGRVCSTGEISRGGTRTSAGVAPPRFSLKGGNKVNENVFSHRTQT